MVEKDREESLRRATEEARDLYVGYRVAEETPSTSSTTSDGVDPLRFYRDYVAKNRPVILRGACAHWPAVRKWTNAYLCSALGDSEISVAFTPNGRADAITRRNSDGTQFFCQPSYIASTFSNFVSSLARSRSHEEVPYIQLQNNSLKSEFASLLGDLPGNGPSWATEALGREPEAANFWCGDERSVTSFHQDHYENIYAVIAGTKEFILLPPHEKHRVHMIEFPAATFKLGPSGYDIVPDPEGSTVRWSALDLEAPQDEEAFPRYFDPRWPKPLIAEVGEGDILYLPKCWMHYVRQGVDKEGRCIACNFWYDMDFEPCFLAASLAETYLQ